MEWRDTDEYTIMHMTGYAKNIYNKRTFSDAIKYDEYIDSEGDRWFSVGNVDLTDYWDKEAVSWIGDMHDIGDA